MSVDEYINSGTVNISIFISEDPLKYNNTDLYLPYNLLFFNLES